MKLKRKIGKAVVSLHNRKIGGGSKVKSNNEITNQAINFINRKADFKMAQAQRPKQPAFKGFKLKGDAFANNQEVTQQKAQQKAEVEFGQDKAKMDDLRSKGINFGGSANTGQKNKVELGQDKAKMDDLKSKGIR